MRITTRAVFDCSTWNILEWEGYEYEGPVAHCKGADVAKDQLKRQNDMQKQAFDIQQQQLNFLKDSFSKYASGNIGFDPQQLAAMRSNTLDNNALQFQDAGRSVRQALLARGSGDGSAPVGGDYGRGLSSLLAAAASNKASSLQGLDIANAQQANANKFNAGSLLSGNAATLNGTQSVAGSGASNALGDYIKAANSGFGASFMNSLGGTLGQLPAIGLSGGFGTLGSSLGSAIKKIPGLG